MALFADSPHRRHRTKSVSLLDAIVLVVQVRKDLFAAHRPFHALGSVLIRMVMRQRVAQHPLKRVCFRALHLGQNRLAILQKEVACGLVLFVSVLQQLVRGVVGSKTREGIELGLELFARCRAEVLSDHWHPRHSRLGRGPGICLSCLRYRRWRTSANISTASTMHAESTVGESTATEASNH